MSLWPEKTLDSGPGGPAECARKESGDSNHYGAISGDPLAGTRRLAPFTRSKGAKE